MAIIHFAYTFPSDEFHTMLKAKIVFNDKIDLRVLHDLAATTFEHASDELKQIFDDMRCDETWLEDPDNDGSPAYLWYTLVLYSIMREAPSLSNNRFHGSHIILEDGLPYAGWSNEEIYKLLFGKGIDAILSRNEFQVFARDLSLHGGCLSQSDIKSLLSHIHESEDILLGQAQEIGKASNLINKFAKANSLELNEALQMACDDAVEMLETALDRDEALYVLRDA